MPRGRPTRFTPKVIAEVCERISLGESVREICADPRMPDQRQLYRRLISDPVFHQQYVRARETQMDRFGEEIVEIADDGSNDWLERANRRGEVVKLPDYEHIARSKLRVETRQWLMGKLAAKKYGNKLDQNLNLTGHVDFGPLGDDGRN